MTANIFKQVGASNHTESIRQSEDFYATHPETIKYLLEFCQDAGIELPKTVIETSVGAGHLAKELESKGYDIEAYDIVDRGWHDTIVQDFLQLEHLQTTEDKCFIQNPPFKKALPFVRKCLSLCDEGEYVCSFLKIQFLEGQERNIFFNDNPPKYVVVFAKRTRCALSGNFENIDSGAMCYCWFIWQKGFKGAPTISWCKRS